MIIFNQLLINLLSLKLEISLEMLLLRTSIVSGVSAKGKPLNFVSPVLRDGKPHASLLKNELDSAAMPWMNSIVLYVVSPTIANMHRYIARDWNFVSKPTVFYHDDGYFLVKLNSMEDRDQVLSSGPHSFFGKPMYGGEGLDP